MSHQDLIDLALQVPCAYCKVEPDVWCKTYTGHRATFLHQSRSHPVYMAYGNGYSDGVEDVRSAPHWHGLATR